jgi:uncharacterized protein (TIGR02594 family)
VVEKLPIPSRADALSVARGQVGLDERRDAKKIMEFFAKNGVEGVDPRITAWCAAYVDAVLGASGNEQRKSLRAADFLSYGDEAKTPSAGNVVVFKPLAAGSSGHVGIVAGIEGDRVRYIAGNDGNAVAEDTLPLSQVAGFRMPRALGGGENNAFGGLPAQSGVASTSTPMQMPDLSPPQPAPEAAQPVDPDPSGFDLSKAIATFANSLTTPAAPQKVAAKPQMPAIRQPQPRVDLVERVTEAPRKANLGAIFGT